MLVMVIVFWAHRGNIRRLLNGSENRATLPRMQQGPATSGRSGTYKL